MARRTCTLGCIRFGATLEFLWGDDGYLWLHEMYHVGTLPICEYWPSWPNYSRRARALTILAGVCRQVVDDCTVIPPCREDLLGCLCQWPATPACSFTLTLELVFFPWCADWGGIIGPNVYDKREQFTVNCVLPYIYHIPANQVQSTACTK